MAPRIVEIVSQLRRRLADLYAGRLDRVLVFGSQARGDDDAGSDVDVLVVLHGAVNPPAEIARTIDDVAALSLEHDVVLSCVFVSTDEFDRSGSPLVRNARREGVPV